MHPPTMSRGHTRNINATRGKPQTRLDIFRLDIRKVAQDRFLAYAVRKHIQDIADADAHSANAWPPTTLLGIEGDPRLAVHTDIFRC